MSALSYFLWVYPATFDRTVFANVEDLTLRTAGGRPWQRDITITNKWLEFVDNNQATEKPFFGFLFYDAAHGYSINLKGDLPYQPTLERAEHLSLGPDYDATAYWNLYRNALYQIDQQIERVFQQLRDKQLLDNTIVVITSDHGEEFNDNKQNYWGHGSNYSKTQLRVPLLVHWPEKKTATLHHQTTHADISVTIMEDYFHTETPRENYTQGYHLLDQDRKNWFIAGSYVNYAIVTPEWHVVTYQNGTYEVMDSSAKPLLDFDIPGSVALPAMQALSEFYN